MKIEYLYVALLAIVLLSIFMFFSISTEASVCKERGGEYLSTSNGGKCFEKNIFK